MKLVRLTASTRLGEVVSQHYQSLGRWHSGRGEGTTWRTNLPWLGTYIAVPAIAAALITFAGVGASSATVGGLLAGVGVLAGFLFQVLASISGRVADLADKLDEDAVSNSELNLVRRLDIARSNTAYASLVSILFVIELGVVATLRTTPGAMVVISAFLLVHLGVTLMLVLVRINDIAQSDRAAALTRKARFRALHGPQKVA